MEISRRITRSQQKKQSQVGQNGATEGQSNLMDTNGCQTSSGSAELEQSVKEWPAVKRSTVIAVVVEKRKKEGEGEAGKRAGENEEAKGKNYSEEKVGEVESTGNGMVLSGIHMEPDGAGGGPIPEKARDLAIIPDKTGDVSGKNSERILVKIALPEGDGSDWSGDEGDDAPEALSLSTGRQVILSQEAEYKRAQDSYVVSFFFPPLPFPTTRYTNSKSPNPYLQQSYRQKVAARLKRKALDTRLKSQKAQAKSQLPPLKRQKLSPTTTSLTATEINATCTQPVSTPSTFTLQRSHSADSLPPGILSPGSSTTLSHQPPPLSPTYPSNFSRTRQIPLLLPDSLLEEVSRLPPPPLPSTVKAPHKLSSSRKTLSDFEAEEKTALVALEKKCKGNKLPIYKKGPVTVAVLGMEEHWEKERRIMAPPGSFTVKNIKQSWLMGRKLNGGERRQMHPVGGKSFVRK